MKIIDYMPGGLGHFIAQIIKDDVSTQGALCFHNTYKNNFDTQLHRGNEQQFLQCVDNWIPLHSVAVTHAWGHFDKVQYAPIEKYQVYVDGTSLHFFYNYWIKVRLPWLQLPADHPDRQWLPEPKFVSKRQEAFAHMRTIHIKWGQLWPAVPQSPDIKMIRFNDFYDSKQSFCDVVHSLNPALSISHDKLWEIFTQSQQPVLDAVDRVRSGKNLTEVDLGALDYCNLRPLKT